MVNFRFWRAGLLTLQGQNIWMVDQPALQPLNDTTFLSYSHRRRERDTRLLYSAHILSSSGIPEVPRQKYRLERVEILWRYVLVCASLPRFTETRGTGFWTGKTWCKDQRRGI